MEQDHVVNIDLEKEEYEQSPVQAQPSISNGNAPTAPRTRSCIVCRKTLLLSYFNCCAICLGVIECTRPGNHEKKKSAAEDNTLPTVEPPRPLRLTRENTSESTSSTSSSVTMVEGRTNRSEKKTTTKVQSHCDSTLCKYTHLRPVMTLFVLCELFQMGCFLVFLNIALYTHDWLLLRYSCLVLLQWWQLFMLSRQWNCGHSIVAGQLAASFFIVWYYVESSQQWRWWEPLAICSVLLKIVFPW
ncbi:hypothetical protein Hte_011303 [Hypoxylon texense]